MVETPPSITHISIRMAATERLDSWAEEEGAKKKWSVEEKEENERGQREGEPSSLAARSPVLSLAQDQEGGNRSAFAASLAPL